MLTKQITDQNKESYNKVVHHPLQSYEWGQFREKTGLKIIRRGIYHNEKLANAFQLTIHPIPHTIWNIGYLPKGEIPSTEIIEELVKIGREERCIFIQIEPNAQMANGKWQIDKLLNHSLYTIRQSTHPLFTRYTFQLDLTKTEEELLKSMHPKTRYNIKVADKHNVEVKEDNSTEAFKRYLELTKETTKRQNFYAHAERYHKLQWETFSHQPMSNHLSSHLFTARFQGKILTTMLFFVFKDTMYYPYGASSSDHRNVMHSTLAMWEAIRWGRKHGLKKLDMWGALGPNPNPKDPWYGFHIFKQRFGPEHIEFVGSLDLIINPLFYQLYIIADKARWFYLKVKNR